MAITHPIEKTYNIFLAYPEEIHDEIAVPFGEFIRQLDYTYEVRGIRIKLFDYDDEDEFDNQINEDNIKNSQMFLAAYRTQYG